MKKILALLLAVLLLICCAACGSGQAEPATEPTTESATDPVTDPATDPAPEATEPTKEGSADRTATYIQLSICEEDGSTVSLTAFDDGEGKASVEFVSEVKKVSTFELSVLADIAAEVEKNMKTLGDQHVYEEGSASASLYVSYSDETFLAADYVGIIPQEFRDGYAAVESYFRQLMTDVPVYVPRPTVEGEPNPDALKEMETILETSGAEPLDMFMIWDVPMDNSFTDVMGLSSTKGVVGGLSCSPKMSAVAFSCAIATAENEAAVADIAEDFASHIRWDWWVCVTATDAMIATKGTQVLCLVTSGDLYTQISTAAENAGWTVVKTLKN